MGLLCVPLVFTAPPDERATVVGYVAITLVLAVGAGVREGEDPAPPGAAAAVENAR